MDLLNEIKQVTVAATMKGLSPTTLSALTANYTQFRSQITNIVNNATFDGQNMTNGDAAINAAVALGDASGNPANNITIAGANIGIDGLSSGLLTVSMINTTSNAANTLWRVNNSIAFLGQQLAT